MFLFLVRPVWFETESGELLCLLFLLDAMMGSRFVGGKYCGAGALQHNYDGPLSPSSVNQVTELHIHSLIIKGTSLRQHLHYNINKRNNRILKKPKN